MNTFSVDLTNCDKEPIHIPGKVQSHGFLLAVDKKDLTITYVSENIAQFVNETASFFLEKPISIIDSLLTHQEPEINIIDLLRVGVVSKNFDLISPRPFEINGTSFYLIISLTGNNLLLEFEPVTLQYDIQNSIGRSASIMLQGKSVSSLVQGAAKEVKNLINYDRIMIYKILDDGSGEVIAEEKNDDLQPFFGLHYPASDIPKQARELYKLNLTRLIADVNTADSPIITYKKDQPLDLTNSGLRAVSPIHIQYLKNMGVFSSFSISLLAHGELWGLVACHNYSQKFIDFKAREGSKLIGQILSSALEFRQEEENSEVVKQFKDTSIFLAEQLAKDKYLVEALTAHKLSVLDITDATGVVIIFENGLKTLGNVPDEEAILALVEWLKQSNDESIYHTHRLPQIYPPAMKFKAIASGILTCTLSKELGEMIIWFKPEKISTVKWAGNPDKPVIESSDGLLNLSPRKSFATWSQTVINTSVKWRSEEISSVVRIREIILTDINKKANAIRLLNEKLGAAYEELDTFSYTISHDLRTPLTSIKTYSELLLKNKSIDDGGRKMLGRILTSANKMNLLIKEILNLAKVGRTGIHDDTINMEVLLKEIEGEVWSALKADNTKLIFGHLPNLKGDKVMIAQVFSNLLTNAVKYSLMSQKPRIEISGKIDGGETIYAIKDNGMGIDNRYYDRVFELFKRMDNVKDIEGTGVGLAIVKRIVERHNGRVWFESELNQGSIFYVALKNK